MASWLIVLCVTVLVCYYNAIPTSAQIGTECSDVKSCMPDQTCYVGYCKCNHGYVKNIRHCFPARLHGQMCYVETQCKYDYRMTCGKRYPHDTYKSCVCNEQHYWDESLQECLQALNVTSVLASQQEKFDNKGQIEKEANDIFAGAVAAGILVVVLGLIFATGCAIYGCCECGWLFEPPPESKKSEQLDKERFRPRVRDPENPPEVMESSQLPGTTAAGNGAGWQTVVSTVPVQAVVLTVPVQAAVLT